MALWINELIVMVVFELVITVIFIFPDIDGWGEAK